MVSISVYGRTTSAHSEGLNKMHSGGSDSPRWQGIIPYINDSCCCHTLCSPKGDYSLSVLKFISVMLTLSNDVLSTMKWQILENDILSGIPFFCCCQEFSSQLTPWPRIGEPTEDTLCTQKLCEQNAIDNIATVYYKQTAELDQ